ncbi:MAG: type II secretion system protein [Eggerthellaceae bacterium]|nr:type II secretion system protein [Eggerthellaceae bacterium]
MAISALAPVAAAAFAATSGFCAARVIEERMRRRKLAESAVADGRASSAVYWWACRGVRPFAPLSCWLLENSAVARWTGDVVECVQERNVPATAEALLSSLLATALVVGACASVLAGTALFGIALVALAALVLGHRARTLRETRQTRLREQTPEALRALAICSKSGQSLSQTMATLANDLEEPLAGVFERASRRLQMGGSATEALAVFSEGETSPELSFVAVALDVRSQTGGSLTQVLESARESVRDELDLRRSLQVQTAQAQLSARIVTCMPFVLVALFSLITEDFLGPFFQSPQGLALLFLALGMQTAGIFSVRAILRREGGQ